MNRGMPNKIGDFRQEALIGFVILVSLGKKQANNKKLKIGRPAWAAFKNSATRDVSDPRGSQLLMAFLPPHQLRRHWGEN